ncbi:hypothetical protein HKBW3S34_02039 [Candidatus Hakubella thermalkaliphila]|uniref:Uncharacterized protein n=5 Tax=Candidatus Hakubella thermalkaliphila TaxID=2754717 RepID=A0A6V8PG82_9ACTN|nr:hypothetical protein HKBW3S34_02039 [Candidatus Hakubella thermalkaliphila]
MLVVLLSISTIGSGASEVAAQQANDVGMVALSLDVQKNGWAQVELKALFDKEWAAEWGLSQDEIVDGIKSDAEEKGWRVASYSEGGMDGLRMTKFLSLVEMQDLRQIFQPDYPSEQAGPLLVIERGFFYTRYRLATDFDLGEDSYAPVEPLPTFQLRLTLPGKVTWHNADEEEGKALVWHLAWGPNRIEAEERAVNLEAMALVIIIIGGALGGTFFAISRLSKPFAPATLPKGAKFCPQCGNSLASGDAFCNRCGTKL